MSVNANVNVIVGAKNYVLINCPDVKEFLYCNIQGLNSDSKTLSLQISKFSKNLLLCGPFIPSSNPFYVQVNMFYLY